MSVGFFNGSIRMYRNVLYWTLPEHANHMRALGDKGTYDMAETYYIAADETLAFLKIWGIVQDDPGRDRGTQRP